MNGWTRNEHDTAELHRATDVPPEACVYFKGDLMALVYREVESERPRWHLYVSCRARMPEMPEVLDARQELLPQIDDYAVTPEPSLLNTVHVWELVDTPVRSRMRWRLS